MATKEIEEHELPNVGAGADTYRLKEAFEDAETVVVLLQRDYHCRKCRKQTKDVTQRYDDFAECDAEVVVVLPETRERAEGWVEKMTSRFRSSPTRMRR